MKRTPLKRSGKPLKRGKLRLVGHSSTSELKREIQAILRQIALLRDKECVLMGIRREHTKVMQYDHLITRANSATYADSRLGVLVCSGCHLWKKWHKEEYDSLVRGVLLLTGQKKRVKLWEECQKDSWRPTPARTSDWKLAKLALEQELKELTK